MENYITILQDAFSKLEKTEKEKIIKNKEKNINNFINQNIDIKKDKISKENILIIKNNFIKMLFDYANSNQNTSKEYYYFTFNKNGSKTIHVSRKALDKIKNNYGLATKLENYYNEYARPLDYNMIIFCLDDLNINHNIDIENKKNDLN